MVEMKTSQTVDGIGQECSEVRTQTVDGMGQDCPEVPTQTVDGIGQDCSEVPTHVMKKYSCTIELVGDFDLKKCLPSYSNSLVLAFSCSKISPNLFENLYSSSTSYIIPHIIQVAI